MLVRPVREFRYDRFCDLRDHNGPAGETGAAIGDVIVEFSGFDTAAEAPTRTEGVNDD